LLGHLHRREPCVLPATFPWARGHAAALCGLSGRVPWLEYGLVIRFVYFGLRRGHLLLWSHRGLCEEACRRQQSMGRRRNDAGVDAVVAAPVPPVRNAAADQIGLMSLVSEGTDFRAPLDAGGLVEPSLATVGDYVALMKPRVMSLVVFTALVGLAVAPGSLHPVTAFTALLCIAVGAGAAGALNMWYDADVDAVMTRTSRRPVP